MKPNAVRLASAVILCLFAGQFATAQDSSLVQRDLPVRGGKPLMLDDVHGLYRPPPPPVELRQHDLITIRVDEKAQLLTEGDVDRRKDASLDAVLRDWVFLEGLKAIRPSPQKQGDQRVRGTVNETYRANSEIETREELSFDITAEIVDIRPNGNLVVEAHKVIKNNDEVWEYSLTGVCRREDIHPNTRLLFSRNIAQLSIYKRERGAVRDGYRRGWLKKAMDLFKVF